MYILYFNLGPQISIILPDYKLGHSIEPMAGWGWKEKQSLVNVKSSWGVGVGLQGSEMLWGTLGQAPHARNIG